jgi:hypothetical protein
MAGVEIKQLAAGTNDSKRGEYPIATSIPAKIAGIQSNNTGLAMEGLRRRG